MPRSAIDLDEAVDLARTGDVWLFRGRSPADRAIQLTTNSPVNHVGMSVVLDDLPPLMWHAELGRSLPDVWTGGHHRGVQLHDLRSAVTTWGSRYGQRAWLRQLHPAATADMEDAVLRTIARLDGTPFPATAKLASKWVRGRLPSLRSLRSVRGVRGLWGDEVQQADEARQAELETAYCAEVVAISYEAMDLLVREREPHWYDPGRFWSGDALPLRAPYSLGGEIAVRLPG